MSRMIGNLDRGRDATLPHPRWERPRHLITSILVVIMLIGASALTLSRGNRSDRPVAPAAMTGLPAMSETLLVVDNDGSFGAEGGPAGASISAYLPGSNGLTPVLDAVQRPTISPDGKLLLFNQITRQGAEVTGSIIALTTSSLATQWTSSLATVMATPDGQNESLSLNLVTAAAGNRVYAVPLGWNVTDPLSIVGLDAATGQQVSRWNIDLDEKHVINARLIPSQDGQKLYVLVGTALGMSRDGPTTGPSYYVRIGLPDGRIEQETTLDGPDASAIFWATHPSGDGRSLYYLELTDNGMNSALRFFDLPSGTALPPISVTSEAHTGLWAMEEAVSHDGRLLYVLDPVQREISIIDLFERRMLASHRLDTSAVAGDGGSLASRLLARLRDILVPEASAKFYFSGTMQLSPDGSRLYAVGVEEGRGSDALPRGIWSIDTATWHVAESWMSDLQPNSIVLSEDGATLFVQEGLFEESESEPAGNLWLIDTRTGIASIASNRLFSDMFSTVQLYRESYGRNPASTGVATGPTVPLLPTAALSATVSSELSLTGDQVTIEARFTDPRDGRLVNTRQSGYRYDPPDRVTAMLTIGATTQAIRVPLSQTAYGVYRGVISLPRPGTWSLRVLAERDDGPASHVFVRDAINVQQSFLGSDGRRYVLKVSSDPRPVAKQATRVRLSIVDAERGQTLPASVTLKMPLPETVELGLFLEEDMGAGTARLSRSSHGTYEGQWTPWTSGTWYVQVAFPSETGEIEYLNPGSLKVGGQ